MTAVSDETGRETLREAAQAVLDRWDTSTWKDAPATAIVINRLRAALSAAPVEPELISGAEMDAIEAAAVSGKPLTSFAPVIDAVATVTYTNWRGETSVRRIIPKSVRYGATEWHPEPQWLLLAWDDDKKADREFALKDFGAAPVGDDTALMLKGANLTISDIEKRFPNWESFRDLVDCIDCTLHELRGSPAAPVAQEPVAYVHSKADGSVKHLSKYPIGSWAQQYGWIEIPIYASPPAPAASVEDDWRDDPSADERWQAGLDYGMERFCSMLGVDPKHVRWDAATEELDGDVCAVIGNILRVKFGDDFDPMKPLPSASVGAAADSDHE